MGRGTVGREGKGREWMNRKRRWKDLRERVGEWESVCERDRDRDGETERERERER